MQVGGWCFSVLILLVRYWNTLVSYVHLLVVVACLLAAACSRQEQTSASVNELKVVTPVMRTITDRREYVAEIQAVKYVEIRSKIKGFIEKIHVDEGQAVKQGQLLFSLNALEHEMELQKANAVYKNAQADLKAAQVELNNVRHLVEKAIISQSEGVVAQAKVDSLQADVEQAAAHKQQVALMLSMAQIRAPFDGWINRIPNKTGSVIAEGDQLTTLSDHREVFAYFNLSETDYLSYVQNHPEKNKQVTLKLANNALYAQAGTIEMIESELDRATGNIAFRARFPNPQLILKHGANAKVVVENQIENALLIPQKSTFEIQDKLYVYVLGANNRLQQRTITEQKRIPDYFVIDSGLSVTEQLVFEGVENLKNGDQIQPVFLDLQQLMAADANQQNSR